MTGIKEYLKYIRFNRGVLGCLKREVNKETTGISDTTIPTGDSKTIGIYRRCSNSLRFSVWFLCVCVCVCVEQSSMRAVPGRQKSEQRSVIGKYKRSETYHIQRIHDDSINMRTSSLIRNLRHIMNHKRSQPQLQYPRHHSRTIKQRIDEQNVPLLEWLHFAQHDFQRHGTDLRGDGEEEFRTVADFGFDPHVALHERHESFGNR